MSLPGRTRSCSPLILGGTRALHHHQQHFAPWFLSLSRQETWMPFPNISGAHACFLCVVKRRRNPRAPRGTGGAQRSPPASACARQALGRGRADEIHPTQGAGGLAARMWLNLGAIPSRGDRGVPMGAAPWGHPRRLALEGSHQPPPAPAWCAGLKIAAGLPQSFWGRVRMGRGAEDTERCAWQGECWMPPKKLPHRDVLTS